MKKRFGKKALSDVVSTLLILLLVFVAVAILWVVIRNVINQGSEQVTLGKFTLDLKIDQVSVDETANQVSVRVKRNTGDGEFVGLKIIVSDDENSDIFNFNGSLDVYEKQEFIFNLVQVDSSNIKKIQVAPIFRLSSGKEVVGDVKDTWESSEGISNFDDDEEIILPPANQTGGECEIDSDCTADNYSPNYCHASGDVYRNYFDFYCNATQQCTYTTAPQIVQDCNSTQTCSGAVCVNNAVTPTCTTHNYTQCYNGDVYWYNSCNVREGINDDCSSTETCTNNQCVASGSVTYAVIGDSMSASYNGWIGYFASKMGISNNAIPTYAVSGNSCENVYSQLINSVSDGTTYLFATCGVNKFASANNTDWYKKIYEKAKEKGISHVYMTTMPPWNYINTLSSSTANTYCNKMQSDNSWLKNFDLQHSDLHVVDLWSMWHGTSGITVCGWRTDQTLTSDGVHPNSAGYTQWADEYYKLFSGSSGDFTIYNSWNFESEELGSYTDNEIAEDFDYTILYSHNSANIVNDVINGQNTKVMRITHEPNKVSVGFEMNVDLGHDYDELYVNYNWKFSNEFDSTAGGKMPGLGGLPNFGNDCPTGGQGFRVHNLFKQAGKMYSYHYDRTGPACPWSTEDNVNEIYMNNGQWYSITQRTVMNTFTNGVANADGIKEVWIDGRLIFQETNLKLMEVKSESMKIDAFRLANFYGGSIDYAPLNEVYGYIDNIKIYMPSDDSVSGHELHSTSLVIDTPDKITDRKVYYDYLKTTPGTFSNSQYGNTYSPCLDEAWLIDAGAGKRVSFTVNSGHIGHDFLFIYDGDKSDSNLIKLFNDDSLSGTYTSTGRYMFVRFSTTKGSGSTGWTGTLSFI